MRTILLLTACCLATACQPAARDARGVDHDETLLTVSATGRADTRPDEARMQLGVRSQAASAGEASRLNREKMDKVTAALARLGVKPDQIQTRNLTLSRIDYGRERGQFRADNLVEVTMKDVGKVGDAVTAVTEAGANVLSGPSLNVSNHEAANRSAYAAAYKAARARADAYADAAGLKVSRILAIYDGGESSQPIPYVRDAIAAQGRAMPVSAPPAPAPCTPFSPGLYSTDVRARVDFALTKK
jgi:uncharacterized protein YggE